MSDAVLSKLRTSVTMEHDEDAETFVNVAGRAAFENYAEYLELYGVERVVAEMPLPRIGSRRLLPEAIRVRLGIVGGDFSDLLLSA